MARRVSKARKGGLAVSVTGQSAIAQNLRNFRKEQAKGVSIGLKLAGLFLQRESQLIVPIDTGALRNSAFTRSVGEGFDTRVGVGYSQDYAIYVHEDLNARHAPGKVAKYLERPLRTKQSQMLKIIATAAKRVKIKKVKP